MLIIKAKQLSEAILKVSSVVDARHINSSLQRCRMFSKDGFLAFLGSNSTMEIEYLSDIEWRSQIDILIDAKKITDLCKLLGDKSIRLELKDKVLEMSSGDAQWSFNFLSIESFPRIDKTSAKKASLVVPAKVLSEMLALSDHAMANNDIREFLNGTLFEVSKDALNVVATDGHRLVFNGLKTSSSIAGDELVKVILPKIAIKELRSNISSSGDKDVVDIEIFENFIIIKLEGGKEIITSKLINSRYPDYEKVIPALSEKQMRFDPRVFKSSVQQAEVVADKMSLTIKLEVLSSRLFCNAEDDIHDKGKVPVDVIRSNVEEFNISFNSKYLIDIFNALGERETDMHVYSLESSVLFTFENEAFTTKMVLMPIRA